MDSLAAAVAWAERVVSVRAFSYTVVSRSAAGTSWLRIPTCSARCAEIDSAEKNISLATRATMCTAEKADIKREVIACGQPRLIALNFLHCSVSATSVGRRSTELAP